MKGARLALLGLLVAAGLPSCMMMAADKGGPGTGCTSRSDCPSGQACDLGSQTCVTDVTKKLLFKVTPFDHERGSGYLPEQPFNREGSIYEMDTSFSLVPSVAVQGGVFGYPDSGGEGVEARMEFVPVADTFPENLRPTQSTSTTAEVGATMGRYDVRLVPGTYDVLIFPAGSDFAELPPYYPGRIAVDTEGTSDRDFTYDTDLRRTLTGTIRLASGDPVPHGLKLWAADASSGRRVSTVMTTGTNTAPDCTDDCPGSFALQLHLSPTVTSVELRVTPDESADAAGYPSMGFGPWDLDELDLDLDGTIDMDADIPEPLDLPLLGGLVVYKAKVEGRTSAGVVSPLTEVSVRFYAERDGAVFEQYAMTNAGGEICIENSEGDLVWGVLLRENDYQVTLTPPAGGEFESLVVPIVRLSYSGDGIQMGQVFQLGSKPSFVGRVLLAGTDEPLEGLTAEAYPIRPVSTGDDGQPLPRFGSDQTGFDGLLRLPLDRGVYDILIRGGSTNGVAWLWKQGIEPGNDTPIAFEMQTPIVMTGTVESSQGDVVASDALVRVYEYVENPVNPDDVETRLIWETTSSGSGAFQIFLSPSD